MLALAAARPARPVARVGPRARSPGPTTAGARRRCDDLVVYELHVGTFTAEGTFDGAIAHLAELAELGVTAIEVMPVADFPGDRGWGYDGVYLWAAASRLRRPGGVRPLRRRRPRRRPRGDPRPRLQPRRRVGQQGDGRVRPVLHRQVRRPSGARRSTTTTRAPTRCANGRCQIGRVLGRRRLHVDGLRLDAIHAIFDQRPEHLVAELSRARARDAAGRDRDRRERAERPEGDARPRGRRRLGLRRRLGRRLPPRAAHADHRRARGLLRRVRHASPTWPRRCDRPHVHDGTYSAFRGRRFGAPADDRAARRSSSSSTRTTTRSATARSATGCPPRRARSRRSHAAVAFTPMLFMGEEYGEDAPFQFFTDHIDQQDRRRHPRRAPARVRRLRRVRRPGDPRPAGPGDVRALEAHAGERDPALAALYRDLLRRAPRLPPARSRTSRFDEEERWLRLPPRRRTSSSATSPRRAARRAGARDASVLLATRRRGAAARGGASALPRRCCGSAGRRDTGGLARAAVPARAPPGTARARTSRSSPSTPSASSCACSTTTATRRASRCPTATAHNWHCYLPGVGPGQRYGYRVHGPYDPQRGPPLQPLQAADRPLRQGDRRAGRLGPRQRAALRPRRPETRRRPRARRRGRRARRCRAAIVVDQSFDWEGDRPPDHPWSRHGHLRDPRQGLHDAPPGRAARTCAAPTPGWPPTRRSHHLKDARRHRGRAAADPPHRRRVVPPRQGPDELLGLQLDRLPGPALAVRRAGGSGEQVREFKGMVKALHRAGIEVILDVVYNHTAEGNHLGPMLSFKGVDNQAYYRLMPDDPRHYMDFTGTGNSLNPVHPERPAADHGLAALLGDRVPRRRLPLRPGLGAGPRALRRRPPVGVLRHDPPGPDPVAGQADRRAVGRRPGRLPGRQLPGAVERSGTASTATRCATSGAARPTSASSPRA